MSPAEELREAAKLMRERAAEAEKEGYDSDHPGKPWCQSWTYVAVRHVQRNLDIECSEHEWGAGREGDCNRWGRYAGYHIAGMHPGVALAVADWLDSLDGIEWSEHHAAPDELTHALKIARAYLAQGGAG